MADLAATDVSFTENTAKRRLEGMPPRVKATGTVAFGDGAKTYPAGGIPLTGAGNALGMPAGVVEHVEFPDATDGGSGILWQYDLVNNKIRGYSALGTEISGAVAATTVSAIITGY